jgi:pimeloyl-ACP methyl ester carboxylesterase
MKTIILPGFSRINKAWAEQVKYNLEPDFPSEFISWKHWETENSNDFSLPDETYKILQLVGAEEINIIAKSIGTLVAMNVISKIPLQLQKAILCGVPLTDIRHEDLHYYDILENLPLYRVSFFQNSNDPHGSYGDVVKFLKDINIRIEVIKKESDDHEYPYWEEFKEILGGA